MFGVVMFVELGDEDFLGGLLFFEFVDDWVVDDE